ncbi:ankyrin repeat domain-containing protein [Candidatus Berkiella aquae]|uniref:Ankyrin repeat domain-containing protein n=1 Tax=Candidatus Berkiella aquae TaxID=295108 RepID=A0A0Q9YPS9_9GAMM|nr:ankyrin repeat domain-containing protein [Candidatus Berkiella aquae]MCS5711859.1 ankyrin repeat domain-containing protein [Candidatus Berkiella aquae]
MQTRDGYLSSIHFAALEGKNDKLCKLLTAKPHHVNIQDRYGMTPLHYAAKYGQLESVSILLQRGANINQVDCDGYPPIFYATSRIKRFLLSQGAKRFDPYFTPLHKAALQGKLQQVKTNLRCGINEQDDNGVTPLMYAVLSKNKKLISYLLKKGADPYAVDFNQNNIIDYAKKDNHHTPLSRFLKKQIGLTKTRLRRIMHFLRFRILRKLGLAKKLNKKLLIILGESHGDYRLYQIEKAFLAFAVKFKIKHLFVETNHDSAMIADEYGKMINKKKKNMFITGVDNHPCLSASVSERNVVISEGIEAICQHGVFITGLHHLYGLVRDPKTKLDGRKFETLPINLAASFITQSSKIVEERFAFNAKKVLQLKRI